jgi:hypothetical protein
LEKEGVDVKGVTNVMEESELYIALINLAISATPAHRLF